MRRFPVIGVALLGMLSGIGPARAEVVAVADNGFVVQHAADVSAPSDQVWMQLIRPEGWWSGKHTYSRDPKNLSIDPRAGGCFCELLPSETSPRAAPRGSVEHMRVIYAEQSRVLRMSGALGPLQGDAVTGTLTVVLKPIDGGTRIMWEYVVGGFMPRKADQMAPVVDAVLGEQITALAAKLGPIAGPAPAPKAAPKPASAPKPVPAAKPAPAKAPSGKAAPAKPPGAAKATPAKSGPAKAPPAKATPKPVPAKPTPRPKPKAVEGR